MSSSKTVSNRHGTAVVTLPSDTQILITRVFDAPAELIFKAWTTPELVKRWWGFETWEWVVCEIDLRVGGSWRYVTRNDGDDFGFHGEFRELNRPRQIVSTETFEGMPEIDATSLNTLTLHEVDGVTTMTTLVQHKSRENRDGHIESGMEGGMQVTLDRLEEVVRELA